MFVEILTADKALLAGVIADSVLYQGACGEHEILDEHVNYMGTVEKGVVIVTGKNATQFFGISAGGFINVREGSTKLLVRNAIDLETVSKETIKEEIKKIEQDLLGNLEDPKIISELNESLLYQQALLIHKK